VEGESEMVHRPKSWMEMLNSKYRKIVRGGNFTTEDLDKANEAITTALTKIEKIIVKREKEIKGRR